MSDRHTAGPGRDEQQLEIFRLRKANEELQEALERMADWCGLALDAYAPKHPGMSADLERARAVLRKARGE